MVLAHVWAVLGPWKYKLTDRRTGIDDALMHSLMGETLERKIVFVARDSLGSG
jgi:hypothetical protein